MVSKLGKTVEVIWEDAWVSALAYHTLESINKEKPVIIRSVGILIRDNQDGVTIAREAHSDNEYRGMQHISRPMVKKVKELK